MEKKQQEGKEWEPGHTGAGEPAWGPLWTRHSSYEQNRPETHSLGRNCSPKVRVPVSYILRMEAHASRERDLLAYRPLKAGPGPRVRHTDVPRSLFRAEGAPAMPCPPAPIPGAWETLALPYHAATVPSIVLPSLDQFTGFQRPTKRVGAALPGSPCHPGEGGGGGRGGTHLGFASTSSEHLLSPPPACTCSLTQLPRTNPQPPGVTHTFSNPCPHVQIPCSPPPPPTSTPTVTLSLSITPQDE